MKRLCFVFLAVVMLVSACGSTEPRQATCADALCASELVVNGLPELVDGEYLVIVCVRNTCHRSEFAVESGVGTGIPPTGSYMTIRAEELSVGFASIGEGAWDMKIEILRAAGGVVLEVIAANVEFELLQPNGPDCLPVCVRGTYDLMPFGG